MNKDQVKLEAELPLMPIRDVVMFPNMIIPFFVGREESIRSINFALQHTHRVVICAAQKDITNDKPSPADIYEIGTACLIVRTKNVPDGRVKILVQGLGKVRITEFVSSNPYVVKYERIDDSSEQETPETKAIIQLVKDNIAQLIDLGKFLTAEAPAILEETDAGKLADLLAVNLSLKVPESYALLEESNPAKRLEMINKHLVAEIEIHKIQQKIKNNTKEEMTKNQREYYLREQLQSIRKELGEVEDKEGYNKKIKDAKMPPEAEKEAFKQAKRLDSLSPDSSESGLIKHYLDWMCEVPWSITTEDKTDIRHSREVLEEDHFGLEDVKERILEFLSVRKLKTDSKGPILCLVGPPGVGKCLGKGTPVMMYDGSIKKVEDVKIGDVLMGDDSTPRNVLSLARGREMMYKVQPVKGDSYNVNESHILSLKLDGKVKDIDVKTYLSSKQRERHKGYRVGVNFEAKQLSIEPYFLGLWLGDGHSASCAVTTMDPEIRQYIVGVADKNNLKIREGAISGDFGSGPSLNVLQDKLKELGVLGNKHIPHDYLTSDREDRLELMAGLIDSDGSLVKERNCYDWISKDETLADNMIYLCRSLGFAAYKKPCFKRAKKNDGSYSSEQKYFRVHISGSLEEVPVRVPRKKASPRKQVKDVLVTGISVSPIGVDDYYGFEIDGNKRFLLGDFTVTHNTSICRSIAKSLGRKYIRSSLGGVRDEAEIRGHRRTYIGSMPGKVIQSLKQAGSKNPVFVLDEIDKMGRDFRGDPSSALLEVLDPEQNKEFKDHYLNVPFDVSQVFFIATANSLETIPGPLLDRMEVIKVSGYTDREKLEICKQYLLPKQKEENGLTGKDIKFTEAAIQKVIRGYTRENGLRNLERLISKVYRKIALKVAEEGADGNLVIDAADISGYLGSVKYLDDDLAAKDLVGVVTGLAWTSVGGETLEMEAIKVPDATFNLKVTGQLGSVMKESSEISFSVVKSKLKDLGVNVEDHKNTSVHVHALDGAVPKDGPSAGITMATVLASVLSDRPVRKDVAMTGELSLTGRVMVIGGVKEKLIAAARKGCKKVLIPKDNVKDLEDVPKEVLSVLEVIPVSSIDEVFEHALGKKKVKKG